MPANLHETRHLDGARISETASDRARGPMRRCWPMLATLALIGLVFAQACSSSSRPSGQASSTPAMTDATAANGTSSGTPSPIGVGAQIINPESLDLQMAKGPNNEYQITVPAAWAIEDPGAPGGFSRRYVLMDNGARIVQIVVRCERDRTVADMISEDDMAVSARGGKFRLPGEDVSVGVLNGKKIDYSISLGGSAVESRVAYLADTPCGWRVLMQSYRAGLRDEYSLLFETALASFRPLKAGPG